MLGRWARLVVGVLLVLVGGLWILQGADLPGQSGGMNGKSAWVFIGGLVLMAGATLLWLESRRRVRPQ